MYGERVASGEQSPSVVFFDGRVRASKTNLQAARRLWLEAVAGDFDRVNGHYVDRASGTLYRRKQGDPLLGDAGAVSVFYVQDDPDGGVIVCLEPAGGTLHELERQVAQADADQAQAEESAAEGRRKRFERAPKRMITLADLEGRELPTVRGAAMTIEEFGGRITHRHGRLIVEVPENLSEPTSWDRAIEEQLLRARAVDATVVLLAAQETVIAELDRRGRLDLERLARRPGRRRRDDHMTTSTCATTGSSRPTSVIRGEEPTKAIARENDALPRAEVERSAQSSQRAKQDRKAARARWARDRTEARQAHQARRHRENGLGEAAGNDRDVRRQASDPADRPAGLTAVRTPDDRHHLLPRLRTAGGEPVEKTSARPVVRRLRR